MKLRTRYLLLAMATMIALGSVFDFGMTSTLAQCAMCRASLGNNSSFIHNFNIGVLVLLIPPVAMFCTILIVAFRYRRSS